MFSNENNKDILICLLESILDVKIFELDYLNLERNVDNVRVRRKYFDLNLITNIGYIQVEVNASNRDFVHSRNTAYICDTYSHYVLRGEDYNEDTMVIQINFSYGVNNKNLSSIYRICDDEGNVFVKNFIIYEFYMDNFRKIWYNERQEEIDKNKYIIMLDLGLKELNNLSKDDKVVRKYMDELKKINANPVFREYMSAEEDNRKIVNSLRREAYNDGVELGKSQGIELGIEQGIEQGIAITNKNIVKHMLNNNYSISDISKITGISVDLINNLNI